LRRRQKSTPRIHPVIPPPAFSVVRTPAIVHHFHLDIVQAPVAQISLEAQAVLMPNQRGNAPVRRLEIAIRLRKKRIAASLGGNAP
jgi:hypothetical protein